MEMNNQANVLGQVAQLVAVLGQQTNQGTTNQVQQLACLLQLQQQLNQQTQQQSPTISSPGGNQFGGNQYGGNQFRGNQFRGNQFRGNQQRGPNNGNQSGHGGTNFGPY